MYLIKYLTKQNNFNIYYKLKVEVFKNKAVKLLILITFQLTTKNQQLFQLSIMFLKSSLSK